MEPSHMMIPAKRAQNGPDLPVLRQSAQPSVADQVFDILLQRILRLELPPRSKLSEADVAAKMGVSRQPVREAFKRLAKQGFLTIRPQSSTTVSLISEEAVLQARFIRTALEVQTCRTACETMPEAGLAVLRDLLEQQKAAITAQDKDLFHALDDTFHHRICDLSAVGYVWDVIQNSKAHMDRIRMLSLSTASQEHALRQHIRIVEAIAARDPDTAAATLTEHLSRILVLIADIKAANHAWFTDAAP
jgi:GntR family transcriptional regulator, rspAB operon transcriptional repressor